MQLQQNNGFQPSAIPFDIFKLPNKPTDDLANQTSDPLAAKFAPVGDAGSLKISSTDFKPPIKEEFPDLVEAT